MENVRVKYGAQGQTIFFVTDSNGTQLAKLIVDVIESDFIISGTEALKGNKRLASKLYKDIISYAREHYQKVIAFNSLVYNKLKHNPEQFASVWDESRHYDE